METLSLSKKRKNIIMIGLTLSVLLAALDSTVVSTAMKKISDDLNGLELYTWPLTIYLLFSTIVTPISGKLADTFGRKLFFIIGTVTFLTGSALCGLAQSMMQLIVFRGLQGIGGGILMSNTFAMIGDIFPPSERAKNTGIVFSAFGLASVIGPVLGGALTDRLSWRWVFYINLPIGIVFLMLIAAAVPVVKGDQTEKGKVDYMGAAALILGLAPMLLAFTWAGNQFAWGSFQIIGLLVLSVFMLLLFALIERKAADPILPLLLFKNKTYRVSIFSAFLSNATMFGAVLFVPLFVQVALGRSATDSGMAELPMMLGFVVASALSGQAISKTGKLKLFAVWGFVVTAAGIAFLVLLNRNSPMALLVAGMLIAGIGIGVNMPVFTLAVQNEFPQSKMGVVTASIQFFRSIGGTIASAVFGTVMLSSVSGGLSKISFSDYAKALPSVDLSPIVKNPNLLTDVNTIANLKKNVTASSTDAFNRLTESIRHVLSASTHCVFAATLIVAVLAVVVSCFLPDILVVNDKTTKKDNGKAEG